MDSKKKAGFVRRKRMAKGGLIRQVGKRKYFDDGGTVFKGPVNTNPNVGAAPGAPIVQAGAPNPEGTQFAQAPLGGGNLLAAQNAYSAAVAPQQQNNYQNVVQAGAQNALDTYQNENTLAGQLQERAAGGGPNPAQDTLNQATGNNISSTAALMAGQRGASVNPGLIAREAGQQGAATEQAAVGQAATLEANQQIAAQGELAGVYGQQGTQALGTFGEAGALQNTQNANEIQDLGMAQGINAQISQANANAVTGGTGMLFGAGTSALSSLSSAFAKGGEVGKDDHLVLAEMVAHAHNHAQRIRPLPKYFDGGQVAHVDPVQIHGPQAPNVVIKKSEKKPDKKSSTTENQAQPPTTTGEAMPWDTGGGMAGGPGDTMDNSAPSQPENDMGEGSGSLLTAAHGAYVANHCPGPHQSHVANFLHDGGPVGAMVSEGEVYLTPEQVGRVVRGGENPLKIGMKIKAQDKSQRAKVKGDSLKNDKIPMDLEEGGVVIDRKHVMSPEKAELFVHRALARKKVSA